MSRLSYSSSTSSMFNEQCKRIQDNLFKILVIGDTGVGKTSMIKQIALSNFSPTYRSSIGVDFIVKRFYLKDKQKTLVRTQLWDIAGQERMENMTRVYYKDAIAAFIVFDVTRKASFDSVPKWKEDLDTKVVLPDGDRLPVILLANKCDQEDLREGPVTNPKEMEEFCKKHEFLAWYETSAKTNIGLHEAMMRIIEHIMTLKPLFPFIPSTSLPDEGDQFVLSERVEIEQTSLHIPKSRCLCAPQV